MQHTIPVRIGSDLIEVLDNHLKEGFARKSRSQLIRDILSEWALNVTRRK